MCLPCRSARGTCTNSLHYLPVLNAKCLPVTQEAEIGGNLDVMVGGSNHTFSVWCRGLLPLHGVVTYTVRD